MSAAAQVVRSGFLSLVELTGPATFAGAAGAFAGGLLALLVALGVRRARHWWGRRNVRVSALAARGATRAEIARRTGIAQDAVGFLLQARRTSRGRRNLPLPARISLSRRAGAHRRNRDWNPQVVAGQADASLASRALESARALPSRDSTTRRSTRPGRAA